MLRIKWVQWGIPCVCDAALAKKVTLRFPSLPSDARTCARCRDRLLLCLTLARHRENPVDAEAVLCLAVLLLSFSSDHCHPSKVPDLQLLGQRLARGRTFCCPSGKCWKENWCGVKPLA